jgi:hypothetical protein
MKTPGERMAYWIRDVLRLSVEQYADTLGMEARSIYDILNNKTKSVIGKKAKVSSMRIYPKFPLEWILTGKGEVPDKNTAEMVQLNDDQGVMLNLREQEVSLYKNHLTRLENILKGYEKQIEWLSQDNERLREEIGDLRKNLK